MFYQASSQRSLSTCARNSSSEKLTLSGGISTLSAVMLTLFDALVDRMERRRTYQTMQALSDRTLDDIGVSRADLEHLRRPQP